MICRITWTDPSALVAEEHIVNFSLKDYYLSYDNSSAYLNCTLLYYFNHADEVLFESAVLKHNCQINNIELLINNEVTHNYNEFNTITNYVHSLNNMDGTPNIVLQVR